MTDIITHPELHLDSVLSALNQTVLRNPATGMGMSIDPYTQVQVNYSYLLSEQQLRALYRGSWYIRRVIEVPADDMTKAGVNVVLHDDTDNEIVRKALQIYADGGQNVSPYSRRRSFGECFRQAEVWARLFGQAYCVLQVNGGEDPKKPLKKVRSIEGMTVLDRYALRPAVGTLNPEYPERYQISRNENPGGFGDKARLGQEIHESRVLVFSGAKIHPYDVQLEGDGGHDSIVQQIWEVFVRHFMAKDSISKGLDSYSLFKVAITGLSTLMQSPNGTETLTNYLNTVAQQMSLHRILVQDSEASKSEFQERSFAGVAENFENFKQELTAATGLPHYKIWGSVDKAGLADSGGAESRAWAETIKAMQQRQFGDNHRRLFHAIFEALGEVPEQWEVEYPSIYTATPEEESNLEKTRADTLTTLVRDGVVTARQAYQAIATGQPLENVCEPLEPDQVMNPVEEEEAAGPTAEEELAALMGGAGAEGGEDAPAETAPTEEEPVPVEGEALPEESAAEEPPADEVEPVEPEGEPEAVEAEAETEEPVDEPEVIDPEEELAGLLGEGDEPEPEDDEIEWEEIDPGPIEEDEEPVLDSLDEVMSLCRNDSISAEEALQYFVGWRSDVGGKGGKGKGRKSRGNEKPDCTIGRSCGMSCVDRDKQCEPDLSPAAKMAADELSRRGGGNVNPFDPRVNPLPVNRTPGRQQTAPQPREIDPFDPRVNPLPRAVRPGRSAHLAPIDRNAPDAFAQMQKREAQIEKLYQQLLKGRLRTTSADSDRIRKGKMGALTALSDARNPKIGLIGSTGQNGYTGFMSYKPGSREIEIETLGTDGSEPGSGRRMFNSLLEIANRDNKGISVAPVASAVGFYEKMGMRKVSEGALELSADEVRELYAKVRG